MSCGEAAIAYRCAAASRLAYAGPEPLPEEVAQAGLTLVERLTRGSHVALVLDARDLRFIAFRGTDDRADWRTNLDMLFRGTPWGGVHRGFQRATERFWPDIEQHVRAARAAGREVWATGHSLGGALALLSAAKLLCADPASVSGVCTFGQPPVGGAAFCRDCDRHLGDRYIRCVNHTDAVADAPILFRRHAGRLWYFDVDGRLHQEVSFRRLALDAMAAPRRFGGLSQFAAHGMDRYLPLLKAAADAAV